VRDRTKTGHQENELNLQKFETGCEYALICRIFAIRFRATLQFCQSKLPLFDCLVRPGQILSTDCGVLIVDQICLLSHILSKKGITQIVKKLAFSHVKVMFSHKPEQPDHSLTVFLQSHHCCLGSFALSRTPPPIFRCTFLQSNQMAMLMEVRWPANI